MLTSATWDGLLQECLSKDPLHDKERAIKEAEKWVRELQLMDTEWEKSQSNFHGKRRLFFYGVEPPDTLARNGSALVEMTQSTPNPAFFW